MDMDDDEGVTFDLTPQWPTTGRTEMILWTMRVPKRALFSRYVGGFIFE